MPTPPAFVGECLVSKTYPSREILIVDLSFNLVSVIAIKLGISLHMNKISFRYERFLDRLRVLQCSREKPLSPILDSFTVRLTSQYGDSIL